MKKLNNVVLVLLLSFMQMNCKNNIDLNKKITLSGNNYFLRCIIDEAEYRSINNELFTFIKGKIEIRNLKDESITFDLKQIKLYLNQDEISNIYINSNASIVILPEIIQPHNTLRRHIYWAFNREVAVGEIVNSKIIVSK